MKKWMIFMRESDGAHFLWNGEGCVRVSPMLSIATQEVPVWHHDYGEIPAVEKTLLDSVLNRKRTYIFTIEDHGRFVVIARGEFKEL